MIPADLVYFSNFALSWIFSWQYRYGKTESNKQFPLLPGHWCCLGSVKLSPPFNKSMSL